MMLLIILVLLTLLLLSIPHLLWLIVWLVSKCFGFTVSYSFFGWSSLCLVLLGWILFAYGYWIGRFKMDINRLEYSHAEIPPSFDGYRIVHISDLHLSTFHDNPAALERIVDSINVQDPDLVCFTGDLVSLGVEECAPHADILRRIEAKDGVVSVLGNHDFLLYSRKFASEKERSEAIDQLVSFERDSLGWKLLRNENIALKREGDSIFILGVDNHSCKNQGYKTVANGDLPKAMQGTDGFRILLSHDPTHWRAEVLPSTNIPLQLSGHTHSAQIRLLGWTPATWTFDEVAGLYTENDKWGVRSLYINVGLGCTLPVRLGVNGEITVLTLRAEVN